jgi:hypothetical protein
MGGAWRHILPRGLPLGLLALLLASPLSAQSTSGNSAIGGTTLSAGIADSQTQLAQAMGTSPGFGSDSIATFENLYRTSGGGPTLVFLGFNPFQFIAASGFNALYWSLITIFLGIMAVSATAHALRGRNPMDSLAKVYFRLLVGVLMIANMPLLYACLMTVNSVLTQGVQAMAAQSTTLTATLQTGSMGTLTFAQARAEAIRNAASRRAVALFPSGASRDEMVQIGTWYNAMATAINGALSAQNLSGQLPLLNSQVWTNAQAPDDQVAAYVGRTVVQNFVQAVADLGALPTSSASLSIAFPSSGSTSLGLLSSALSSDDAQAAQAMTLPNTPSSSSQFEAARQLYSKNVQADTLNYLDTQVLPVIGASPTLAQRVKAWFSEKVEQAAAAATGFMSDLRSLVDWVGRSIGVVLTRMVAFVFTAGVQALLEINLFVLVLAMPFWLLPSTETAFYGVLRSLVSLSIVVPAYQFLMLFVDALMALALRYLLFGPLANPSTGALQSAAGAGYTVAAALVAFTTGGEIVAVVTFCYLVAYLFLAVYMAIKTPKLIAVFLKGAGVAGAFVTTFATGVFAGAATALLTTAVAGGAFGGSAVAGRLLGSGGSGLGGGLSPGAATSGGPQGGSPPVPRPRVPLGSLVASSVSPPPAPRAVSPQPGTAPSSPPTPVFRPANPAGTAVVFGVRTFLDTLSAESPGHGFQLALANYRNHLKRSEEEEERHYRAQQRRDEAARHAQPPA